MGAMCNLDNNQWIPEIDEKTSCRQTSQAKMLDDQPAIDQINTDPGNLHRQGS